MRDQYRPLVVMAPHSNVNEQVLGSPKLVESYTWSYKGPQVPGNKHESVWSEQELVFGNSQEDETCKCCSSCIIANVGVV